MFFTFFAVKKCYFKIIYKQADSLLNFKKIIKECKKWGFKLILKSNINITTTS